GLSLHAVQTAHLAVRTVAHQIVSLRVSPARTEKSQRVAPRVDRVDREIALGLQADERRGALPLVVRAVRVDAARHDAERGPGRTDRDLLLLAEPEREEHGAEDGGDGERLRPREPARGEEPAAPLPREEDRLVAAPP